MITSSFDLIYLFSYIGQQGTLLFKCINNCDMCNSVNCLFTNFFPPHTAPRTIIVVKSFKKGL